MICICAAAEATSASNASGEIRAFASELVLLLPLSGAEIQHQVAPSASSARTDSARTSSANCSLSESIHGFSRHQPWMSPPETIQQTEGCSDEVAGNDKEMM
jgi:hypothetical protein